MWFDKNIDFDSKIAEVQTKIRDFKIERIVDFTKNADLSSKIGKLVANRFSIVELSRKSRS